MAMQNETKQFRVGFLDFPPYSFACAGKQLIDTASRCVYPGTDLESIDLLMRFMKANWTLVNTPKLPPGYDALSYTFESLANGTIDVSPVCFTDTEKNREKAFLTGIANYAHMCVLTSDATEDGSGLFQFLHVFSVKLWILAAVVLAIIFAGALLLNIVQHNSSQSTQVVDLSLCKVCSNKNREESFSNRFSSKLGVLSMSIWMIFVLNAYQNGILTELLSNKRRFLFDDMDSLIDVLQTTDLKLVGFRSFSTQFSVKLEKSGVVTKDKFVFKDTFQTNEELLDYLRQGKGAFVTGGPECDYVSATTCGLRAVHFEETRFVCKLTFTKHLSMKHRQIIEESIKQIEYMFLGIFERYRAWLGSKIVQCPLNAKEKTLKSGMRQIRLDEVIGVICLLCLGLIFGFGWFLLEQVKLNLGIPETQVLLQTLKQVFRAPTNQI